MTSNLQVRVRNHKIGEFDRRVAPALQTELFADLLLPVG